MTRLGGAPNGALPEPAALWAAACNSLFEGRAPEPGAYTSPYPTIRFHSVNVKSGQQTGDSASIVANRRDPPNRLVTPEVAGSSPVAPANDTSRPFAPPSEFVGALVVGRAGAGVVQRARAGASARVFRRPDGWLPLTCQPTVSTLSVVTGTLGV
jgi:hypothetical protein